jgi:hypothetical protein
MRLEGHVALVTGAPREVASQMIGVNGAAST